MRWESREDLRFKLGGEAGIEEGQSGKGGGMGGLLSFGRQPWKWVATEQWR